MKKILLLSSLLLIVFLSGCQKKPESLIAVEECITNQCEDEKVEELMGLYFDEYIEDKYIDNPFEDATQRPHFYGEKEDEQFVVGSIISIGYTDETSSYSKQLRC